MATRWIEPKYSKKRVRKAGEILKKDNSGEEFSDALEVLSNWRSTHAYPMHALLIPLRRKSKEVCKSPVVVQRLKRTPSIINKLKRMPAMSLDRMQDIAGCRSVVSNLLQVRQLSNAIKNTQSRNILHNEKDYINEPKESGYRCVHLIYKYNASKAKYKNFFVELQLRSKIQHAWATAVEVVDIFTKQALKASYGEQIWKDFFRYVSAEFAHMEKAPVDEQLTKIDTFREIKKIDNELSVLEKLHAFAFTTKHMEKNVSITYFSYYILKLDANKGSIQVRRFGQSHVKEATDLYMAYEKQYAKDKGVDVVLVSGDSIKSLKKAYPNYFADTAVFSNYLKKILEK